MVTKTNKGTVIDMEALRSQNSDVVAVTGGGVSMNARGDMLGRGGEIIRKREDLERAYAAYAADAKNATKKVNIRAKNAVVDNVDPNRLTAQKIVDEQKEIRELSLEQAAAMLDGIEPVDETESIVTENTEDVSEDNSDTDTKKSKRRGRNIVEES